MRCIQKILKYKCLVLLFVETLKNFRKLNFHFPFTPVIGVSSAVSMRTAACTGNFYIPV